MKQNKIKKGILLVFIVFLSFPIIEFIAPFKLSGLITRTNLSENHKELTFKNWLDGSFQESFMTYVNDNIGLFSFFVKTHNQIEYSFFGIAHTGRVITGKKNYLFEQGYINSYYGENYAGLKKIKQNTLQLKTLEDTLSKIGKPLLFCITADKTTYYPELLPDQNRRKDTSNYETYSKYFQAENIAYIDFNNWFLDMKDSLGHLLYPQYGVHWSHYSTFLVTDSIVRYLEKKAGWDLPNLKITKTEYSSKAKYHDNDIVNAMNLFVDAQPDESMIYPTEFKWDKPNKKQPQRKLLIIGDSFTRDIFEDTKLGSGCFQEVHFWRYHQTVHEYGNPQLLPNLTRKIQLYKALKYFDAFVIISSHPNLTGFCWEFINDANRSFKDTTYYPKERYNELLKNQLISKSEWKNEIQKRAQERGVSSDSIISLYLHDKNYKPNN